MPELKLVDFTQEFVQIFHKWMQEEEVLQLTSTDPMSLEDVTNLSCQSLKGHCIVKIILLDGVPIGDVDLFYSVDEDLLRAGEINILIAEKQYRSKGYGKIALVNFIEILKKQADSLRPEYLCAKINKENAASIRLFENAGFVKECDVPNVFDEFKLIYKLSDLTDVKERIHLQANKI
jgi:RimJ/RimL family protein N-acetyltransferase